MDIVLLLLALPLIGFVVLFWLPARQKNLVGGLAFLFVLVPFLLSFSFYFLPSPYEVSYFPWLNFAQAKIQLAFRVDLYALWMIHIVTGIGALVHLFSIGYMREEEGYNRYFAFLNLFIFFMLLLVTSSNLLFTFFGWEGVGLCSYFLIGHFYKLESAKQAANKAFIMNRIGDFGFILAMFLLYRLFGSLEYATINQQAPSLAAQHGLALSLASFLIFWSCTAKSAQFPLFTWLPDAMEGPTPVSALIHAATMVAAGVYLVVRLHPLFLLTPITQQIMLYIAAFTSLVAALIATRQWDIKKILAYSTVSQLGFMFVSLGLNAPVTAIFHLSTHAFFKALLFLASGAVIFAMHHQQDILKMGGLRKTLRSVFLAFAVGAWCLAGLPLGSGFFSKESILNYAYQQNLAIFAVLLVSSFLTAYYIFRLIFFVFVRPAKAGSHQAPSALPKTMVFVLAVLGLGSLLVSFINLPSWISGSWAKFLPTALGQEGTRDPELHSVLAEWIVGILALVAALAGYFLAYLKITASYTKSSAELTKGDQYNLFVGKFFLDPIYDEFFVQPYKKVSQLANQFFEPFFYGLLPWLKNIFAASGSLVNALGSSQKIAQQAFVLVLSLFFLIGFLFAIII